MNKPIRLTIMLAILLAGVGLNLAARAQTAADESDPPTRVARLSYLDGAVSFVPAGENDWVEADLNRPLVTGDRLWTDRDSRAVLELGDASIRMDQRTSFDFLNLDDSNAQIELTEGTLNLRVRRLYDGQSYEIDTPTLAFVVNRVGEFRIDVAPSGDSTIVTVRSGGGDVYGEDDARFQVEEGQSVVFRDSRLTDYEINDLPSPDDFDDFCYQRDRRWDDSTSRRYVSEEVIGYQDLDNYGQWDDVPDYGEVWYPTSVAAGWAPYRYGHWVWIGLYGWTWIDDAPWGFAPFHYGRWAFIRGRWGWCPGPRAIRPVYAPALVAFVGGVGVSISSGPIGWFPLGRGDIYFPPYHVSRRYFTRLNGHDTHIRRDTLDNYYGRYARGDVDYGKFHYANRHVHDAVTAVPARAFVDARSVSKSAIRIHNATFAQAQVHGFARLSPTRTSLARTRVARARPSASVFKRHIVAATRPPVPIAAFSAHEASLQKNPGRPVGLRQLREPVNRANAAHGVKPAFARPNVSVVTRRGTPVRGNAPKLPKRTGEIAHERVSARPATHANPPPHRDRIESTSPATRIERNHPTPQSPRALESSRFAHPSNNPANVPAHVPQNALRERTQAHPPRREVAHPETHVNRAPRPTHDLVQPQQRVVPIERNRPAEPQYRRVEPQVRPHPVPQQQPNTHYQMPQRPAPRVMHERPPRNAQRESHPPPHGKKPPHKDSGDGDGHGHGHRH